MRGQAYDVARHDAASVPYLDSALTLAREPGRTRAHRVRDVLKVPAEDHALWAAVERWFRRAAHAEIGPRLDRAAAAVGGSYSKLSIRNQRTRWASCSTSGMMSFNWRLLLGPEEVLDYVIWHEACHLVHHDHSRRYWALVEHHLPTYRAPRRWLQKHGHTLVLPAT